MKKVAALLMLAVLLPACQEEEPPERPAPPPPPPPSAEELSQEALPGIIESVAMVQMVGQEAASKQIKSKVQSTRSKLLGEPNGDAALRSIRSSIKDLIQTARESESWEEVLVLCDALETFNPDSKEVERIREQATLEKNKPEVKLMGFTQIGEAEGITAHLEVHMPKTGETENIAVRENEEFKDMKFIEMIGDRRGVKVMYVPTGDIMEIMKDSR
jgi:hypothetical protein